MRATNFEYRHQTLVHELIVGAGFLTYLIDPDDIVWRFVRNSSAPRLWERSLFIVATILIAVGAALCTRARAIHTQKHLGELLYAIGLGSLMPLPGFVILVAGESLRILRLMRRQDPVKFDSGWRIAFRRETVKWGILLTMIDFVITLKDRHAEILAVASFLAGVLFNLPFLIAERRVTGEVTGYPIPFALLRRLRRRAPPLLVLKKHQNGPFLKHAQRGTRLPT